MILPSAAASSASPAAGLARIAAASRGQTDAGWLKSWHSFSFGEYHDPARMGFYALRVINDDVVAGGGGFPMHPHRDMEIVTIVLAGELAHRDSLGNGATIKPGDVQRMAAGTGILHSEFNASAQDPVHLLQIWILPKTKGEAPGYAQKHFAPADYENRLRLVASADGREESITINQDLDLYRAHLQAGAAVQWSNRPGHALYLHVAAGAISLNGTAYAAGDAATLLDQGTLDMKATCDSDILLFDQPAKV